MSVMYFEMHQKDTFIDEQRDEQVGGEMINI